MSPEDANDLAELASELAEASHSLWQPRCIATAFARHARRAFTLTMQAWIDLDACASPILHRMAPAGDDAPDQLRDAMAAFGSEPFDPVALSPEEAATITREMIAAVDHAFSTCLRMRQPGVGLAESPVGDGFGSWLPILARLIAELGMARAEALDTPVAQAFALIAAHRRNQGWLEAGVPYALREIA